MRELSPTANVRPSDTDRAAAIVVTVLCVGGALADLAVCWRDAPVERQSGWAFFVWMLPAALGLMGRGITISRPLLAVGAACAVGAQIADIHLLGHIGMAASLAAWLPAWGACSRRRAAFWRLSALAWMPVSGWLTTALPAETWLPPRFAG